MISNNREFDRLLQGFLARSLSKKEIAEFFDLLKEPENHAWLTGSIDSDLENKTFSGLSAHEQYDKAYSVLMAKIDGHASPGRVVKLSWIKWAAAAVFLGLGLSAYFMLSRPNATVEIAEEKPVISVIHDVEPPHVSMAVLTLANGRKIILDSAGSGSLAIEGQTNVVKLKDGQIAYHASGSSQEMQFNILTVPRGSRVAQITLADGTAAWINVGSSLKYPVDFIGNERAVEITGEVYFEVAKNAAMPFIVHKAGDDTKVQVLGTHLNVSAYSDESSMNITLLEGSVKVIKGENYDILKPGQQARVSSVIKVVDGVDVEEVMAWKNGFFHFANSSLADVMRQISRWYDVDFDYTGKLPERQFGGEISRGNNVSQVLKILEESDVHFRIEGKKIVMTP
ncbi:MAG: FecR domain-containing protein [Flavitalea sp.]